ncbi:type II secretion system F family protein [Croceicoccus ponticola]|uniref:Type II secretion system F family protein n=1 Tax=Croceicoccus ponticola TaxID=2217664 RepID=A0A437GYB9_9SPHN|nr:type II secretion system F family protein [Croceicoccus ponticola]RVQ66466.1 type II secretion system F family protein [Croceicoccus ponticola]
MINNPAGPTLLGFDVILVGTLLAGIAALAAMMAVYAAVTVRDPMAKRVKSLAARREDLKAGLMGTINVRRSIRRKTDVTNKIRDILGSLKMLQDSQLATIEQKLTQAGIRRKELAYIVVAARPVLMITFGLLAATMIYWTDMYPGWGSIRRFNTFAAILIFGYKGPDIWLKNVIGKRTTAIRKGLPDALDLLVICAEAGLTVDAAFGRVSKELGRAYPELADEFALTSIELSFLSERKQAFDNLAYRVDLEAVKGVTTTMVQTERYGTPLASALRVLSAEFRNQRMMRAEEKAARLPAIMTVPLILFILPVLFIVILGPAACAISDTFLNRKS